MRPVRSGGSEERQKERGRKDDIVSGYDRVPVSWKAIPPLGSDQRAIRNQ